MQERLPRIAYPNAVPNPPPWSNIPPHDNGVGESGGDDSWNNYTASTIIYNDKLFVSTSSGILYALNKNNGSVIWFKKIGDKPTSPVVNESHVFVGNSKGLTVFNLTGGIQWEIPINQVVTDPVIINDMVILGEMKWIFHGCLVRLL